MTANESSNTQSPITITVGYDSDGDGITFDGLDSVWVGLDRLDSLTIAASAEQPIHFVRDAKQTDWRFEAISFFPAGNRRLWRAMKTAGETIDPYQRIELELTTLEDDRLYVLNRNQNEGAESLVIRFQITIEDQISGELLTSHDPQILNEKDGGAGGSGG
ncbi:MAG: hypothetical protein AAF772_20455 [Acidobacteriota bacterium]